MENVLLFLLLISPFGLCLDYSFSLSYPFLLRNDYMGITSATGDIENQVLIFLQNNQVRRYSSDLTSYTLFHTPDLVTRCSSDSFALSGVQLSNGTSFNIQGKVTTTISRTSTTIKTYSYPSFTLLSDYQGSETLIEYKTVALQYSSNTPINIIIGSLTVKVYYRSQIVTVFDYGQIFTPGVICTAAKFQKITVSQSIDFINSNVAFYIALNNNKIIELTVMLSLQFNFASQLYGLFPSASYIQMLALASPSMNFFFQNRFLFMQEANGQISVFDTAGAMAVAIDGSIPTNNLQQVVFKDSRWYMLYNNELIEVYQSAAGLSLLSSIASYPSKQYSLVRGINFDFIYVSGESYIFKMGYCLGQTYFDGVGCSSYNCFDTMCTNCWMHSSPCGVCNAGYPRTDNYQCLGSPPNNTANSTATTNSTTPTNSTSSNSTNTINLNSSSSAYSSLITTLASGYGQDFTIFLSNLLKFSISLPSGRRIVYPLFYFFGNFDDIYLYSFHDAFYGSVAEGLFQDISDIQNAKWSLLEHWGILKFIFGQQSLIRKKFSYRTEYLRYQYHLEGKVGESEGLFCNSYDFFLFSLPVSIILFVVLRAAYKCSKRYAISRVFRIFSLWGFLLILNFDGNIQQFTFFLFAEIKNLSFFSPFEKALIILALLFGFIIIILSFGGYLVGLFMYRKLNRNLTDNNRNSMRGNMQLLFQNCMRNFLLGAAHSLLRYGNSNQTIISILLAIEIAFQGLFVVEVTRGVFKVLHKFWFYFFLSFTRITLIITFYLQHRSHSSLVHQQIQMTLILVNISFYILSIVFLLCQSGYQIFKFLQLLLGMSRPTELSCSPIKGSIKARVFSLRRIARQNQKRRVQDTLESNRGGQQGKAAALDQLIDGTFTLKA